MLREAMLALVDAIHREKEIEKDLIFEAIEIAMAKAAAKKYELEIEPQAKVDRETGDVTMYAVEVNQYEEMSYNEETGQEEPIVLEERIVQWDQVLVVEYPDGSVGPVDPADLGRVAAQTAKQVIIQRLREAERDVVYEQYVNRKREMVTGTVQRREGPNLVVSLGKAEAFFPRWEQIPDEPYENGDRVGAIILDVKALGQKVKIVLSRTHPDFVARLFEREIPEIQDKVIEIKGLVREPGFRSKVAVSSIDRKIDAVAACVGQRGMRIRNITEELGGEKVDVIRWSDEPEVLVMNALKPAEITSITLDYDNNKARVVVPDDQLSLAIGKKGQNVRLASRLSGWHIDILNQADERKLMAQAVAKFETIPGVGRALAERIFNAGYSSFDEILEAGPENLAEAVEGVGEQTGKEVCEWLFEIDEDEYLREVVVEMPETFLPVTAREAAEALFAGGGEVATEVATEGEGEASTEAEPAVEGAEGSSPEAATTEAGAAGPAADAAASVEPASGEEPTPSAAELFGKPAEGSSSEEIAAADDDDPARQEERAIASAEALKAELTRETPAPEAEQPEQPEQPAEASE